MKIKRLTIKHKYKDRNDATRIGHDPWYKKPRWRKLRKQFLNANPLCQYCLPKVTTATIVDHLRPRRLYPELEWEESNFIPTCHSCHRKKSGKEAKIKDRSVWEEKMKDYVVKFGKV